MTKIPPAAAAQTLELLKHGKEVEINILYVFLAYAHTSVLKGTAIPHRIRLTGEMVLRSACSRAKMNRAHTPYHH